MHNVSGEKMEQVIIAAVSTVVILCATFLGYYQKVDAGTVYTGVVSGLFGYSGAASRSHKKEEKEESETKE